MAPKKILAALPDEKMLPEAVVLSETGHSTVEFPLAQLDPKRSHAARSEVRQWPRGEWQLATANEEGRTGADVQHSFPQKCSTLLDQRHKEPNRLEESVAISDKKIFRHRSLGRLFATTTSHLTDIGSRQRAVYNRRAVGQTKLNGLLDQRARLGRRARLVGTRALPSAHPD